MLQMTSPHKIAYHREKLQAFLSGQPIFPVTVEMDITAHCPQQCPDCPSTPRPGTREFSLKDIGHFFRSLEGQTQGLLLSGGEPTSSPLFPAVLVAARNQGLKEIAIMTNGAHLGEPKVAESLLEHATVIRISLYDWEKEITRQEGTILHRVGQFRRQIDRSGSRLHIGVSVLTSADRLDELEAVAEAVRSSGAHWIYFHPFCTGWGSGTLSQTDQTGVVKRLRALQARWPYDFAVHFGEQRYENHSLMFSEYYSSHFLMVVGADGINYLGTEVKYQDAYAIAKVTGDQNRGYLRQTDRLQRIRGINHLNYPPLGGRHRGLLYNHFVEQVKQGQASVPGASLDFLYPHIL
jgi:organic radical activating enzyme